MSFSGTSWQQVTNESSAHEAAQFTSRENGGKTGVAPLNFSENPHPAGRAQLGSEGVAPRNVPMGSDPIPDPIPDNYMIIRNLNPEN
jgi:hypothetical protein